MRTCRSCSDCFGPCSLCSLSTTSLVDVLSLHASRQSRLEIAEKHSSELTVNLGIAEDTLRETVVRMEKERNEQTERLNIDLSVLRAELEKTRNALREAEAQRLRARDELQEERAATNKELEALREQSRLLSENARCSMEKTASLAKENENLKGTNADALS